jgi:hypothetical protein
MSTDGVRFAHCVSVGSSLCLRGEESGAKAGAFAYAGKREAKAGAFAYPGEESGAKAGAFAYAGRERQRLEPSLTRGRERQRLEPSLTRGRERQRLEPSLTQLCRFYWTSFTVRTWKGVNARGTRRFSSICSGLIGSSKMLTRSASRRGSELSMTAWPRSP